jgi:tRNA pseudouridine65 synthase
MFEKLFENEKCLIINKPNGISVHNAEDLSVIKQYENSGLKLYPVHRIDKETSGILILAKDSSHVNELSEALKRATKSYLAICRGIFKNESGTFRNPISDKAEGRKNPAGTKSNQKEAISEWKLLNTSKYFSELLVTIKTGRTHQIRKHCALNKRPIIGDKRYSDKAYNEKIAKIYNIEAMTLHAYKLVITLGNNEVQIECPKPEYFEKLMKEN